MPDFSDIEANRVLLVGDIEKAFLDADAVGQLPCEIKPDILDAIDVAAKGRFAVIGIVMSGMSGKLTSALRVLRESNLDTKIVLLAQMYEEPLAMRLVGLVSDGSGVSSDYLICPIQAKRFYESVVGVGEREKTRLEEAAAIDAPTEAKIRQLEKLATTDELTGLRNRRYLWEFSRQILEYARGENGRVTLLVFDIDDFKHYNDVYGHSAGDEILKQAAILMQRSCRSHDVIGRVGGDEFAVVFWDDPCIKSRQEAERRLTSADHPREAIFIAQRFRRELGKAELSLLGPEGKGVLTISGGLASFPRDGATIEELFEQADGALLEAKHSGKNRIYLVGGQEGDISDIA